MLYLHITGSPNSIEESILLEKTSLSSFVEGDEERSGPSANRDLENGTEKRFETDGLMARLHICQMRILVAGHCKRIGTCAVN